MKIWRRLIILFLVGILLSWSVSCTQSTSNSSNQNNQAIEFWTMQLQPQFTEYFNTLITNFEAANPETTVKWVDVPWSAMESKILAAVSAKTAPDVVNLNPDFAALLAGRNAWLNIGKMVSDEEQSKYLPNIWQANHLEVCQGETCTQTTFGLPWYLTTQITIYNTELLKQAGIVAPPKTYAELAKVAQQVKEKTGKYAAFFSFVPEDSAQVLQSLVQMDVQLVDPEGKAAFNTPAGQAAFQYWVDLYQQKLLPQEVLTQGHRRAVELYQGGELVILASGPQFFQAIADSAPDIAKVSAPAPQMTGQTGKKTVAVMNLVIPQQTDHPDQAVKFALFVTNPQNQLAFSKAANVLPSTAETLKDQYFQTLPASPTPADQARMISAQELSQAEMLLPPLEDIKQLQKVIYENLQAAMLNQKTVAQAIADAETAWNQR
ncbi:MAG: ABC transporter substrate-binding protein [Microcoleaceae cyanobacterium]